MQDFQIAIIDIISKICGVKNLFYEGGAWTNGCMVK